MTVEQAKRFAATALEGVSDYSDFEATEILAFVTEIKRTELIFSGKKKLSKSKQNKVKRILRKRKKGVPLQYIIGEWEFYSLNFKVGKGVLIPRCDTEILVEAALEYLSKTAASKIVFDLCSGSGAIGITLSHKRPDDRLVLVEKSQRAVKYLKKNNLFHGGRCEIVKADVLRWKPEEKCDLLVCNPPYIRTDVIGTLSKEVKNEPKMALDGGSDGLKFYKALSFNAKQFIKPGGRIMFEIGFDQKSEVEDILKAAGFKNIKSIKDYGRNDRVVFGDFTPD